MFVHPASSAWKTMKRSETGSSLLIRVRPCFEVLEKVSELCFGSTLKTLRRFAFSLQFVNDGDLPNIFLQKSLIWLVGASTSIRSEKVYTGTLSCFTKVLICANKTFLLGDRFWAKSECTQFIDSFKIQEEISPTLLSSAPLFFRLLRATFFGWAKKKLVRNISLLGRENMQPTLR